MSRGHARITIKDDEATLEDLTSKNGTQVMGETIKGPTVLKDGDEVEFGHVKGWFIVEASDDPPDHDATFGIDGSAVRSPSTKTKAVALGEHRAPA